MASSYWSSFGKGKPTVGRKKKQSLEESTTNQDDQESSGTRKSNRKRKTLAAEESDQSDQDSINEPQEDLDNQDNHSLTDNNEE